jgi:hypothetical protein
MRQCIEDERCFRKLKSDPAAIFLDWEDHGFTRNGMSIIIVRSRRVCKTLFVGLKLEGSLLGIKTHESEKKIDAAIGIGRYLTRKNVRPQKFENLLRKEKHGATFATLRNNPVSNKIRCLLPVYDNSTS